MSSSFKVLLLTVLVLQNTLTALLGRYTRQAVAEEDLYEIGHFILASELFKLVTSVFLELIACPQTLPCAISRNRFEKFKEHLYGRPCDLLKMSVTAAFYWASNTLLYVAISNLSVPMFQVLVQTKLVVTAAVSVLMLGSRYSPRQWVCLVVISTSAALITLEGEKGNDTPTTSNAQLFFLKSNAPVIIGSIAVALSCFLSAFAGVYCEKVLKTDIRDSPSIWTRNIQLAFCSIVVALFQQVSSGGIFSEKSDESNTSKPFLHGFTPLVWCLVFLFSGGGLLVSAVIKYADNVLKGIAIGMSVLLSTVASMILYRTPVTPLFNVCAFATVTAVYFFSNDLPACDAKPPCCICRGLCLILLLVALCFMSTIFQMLSIPLANVKMQIKDELTLNTTPGETGLLPSDWNSTEKAHTTLSSLFNRTQERFQY
jgi:UDP-sugar transporter A1/2/3